ncbi:MAG: hypothetical protein U9O98_03740, partial [Asgard group archaeon]|nr:hypothetical protein [Asgard group archaeon]
KNGEYEGAKKNLEELLSLTEKYPNDEDFILQRANGIVTGMTVFKDKDEFKDFFDELDKELTRMAKIYPDHEGVQLRNKTKSLGRN